MVDWQGHDLPGKAAVGDASHVMPPFTGKGVNLALLDALELADAITGADAGGLHMAIQNFEARMQAPTRIETDACLAIGRQTYGIDINFNESRV